MSLDWAQIAREAAMNLEAANLAAKRAQSGERGQADRASMYALVALANQGARNGAAPSPSTGGATFFRTAINDLEAEQAKHASELTELERWRARVESAHVHYEEAIATFEDRIADIEYRLGLKVRP